MKVLLKIVLATLVVTIFGVGCSGNSEPTPDEKAEMEKRRAPASQGSP